MMNEDANLAEIARLRADLAGRDAHIAQQDEALKAERAAREMAEADNAGLLTVLREIDLTCSRPDRIQVLLGQARNAPHPGRTIMAQMLSDLNAARAVVAAMRQIDKHVVGACETIYDDMPEPCDECGEMREIAAQALKTYDEAVKRRSE